MAAHEENPTNEGNDARLEAVLLQRVLDLHPTRVTTDELVRDLTGTEDDFAARDGIERAIAELTRAGLLHPVADGFVTPTRAAVRLGELLGPVS
ncbi:MAG TPA: hypothetical protein VGH14_05060 [Solirubrobacterales bacterium]|jgi:hypothetical protein